MPSLGTKSLLKFYNRIDQPCGKRLWYFSKKPLQGAEAFVLTNPVITA